MRAATTTESSRKRAPVGLVVILLLLAGGGGGAFWWHRQAEQARQRKEAERRKERFQEWGTTAVERLALLAKTAKGLRASVADVWRRAIKHDLGFSRQVEFFLTDPGELHEHYRYFINVESGVRLKKLLEEQREALASHMQSIPSPPPGDEARYEALLDAYGEFDSYAQGAISPSGSLLQYTQATVEGATTLDEKIASLKVRFKVR